MALLFLRNVSPSIGPVIFVATMNVSLNVQSPSSNWSWTVFVGVSMSPFASCNLKVGGSISLSMLSGLTDLIFWYSLSGRQLTSAPESTSASTDRLLKSIGAKSIFRFFFRLIAEKIGMHFSLVSGSVITVSFSCLLVWIQSSSYSGLSVSMFGV